MSSAPSSSSPVATKPARDPRLDFFRGAALVAILYDHIITSVGGHVPAFLQITPVFWGLTDAAIVFVFISGQLFGRVYGRLFDREGWRPLLTKVSRRIAMLYGVNGAAFLATWAVINIESFGHVADGPIAGELLAAQNQFGTFGVLWAFARFGLMPNMFDVLPLYMVLLAVGPLMLVGIRRAPVSTVVVSLLIYVAAQMGGELPYATLGIAPLYLNPLAWQLVFLVGIAVPALDLHPPRQRVLIAAGIVVMVVVAVRIMVIPGLAVAAGWANPIGWMIPESWMGRGALTIERVIYSVIFGMVIAAFVRRDSTWLTHRVAHAVCVIGRHTLITFSFGVHFTWSVMPLITHAHAGLLGAVLAAALGMGLTVAIAWTLEWRLRRSSGGFVTAAV